MQVRLQKFMADAGVASRRACEEMISAGRVTINGQRVTQLGVKVDPQRDRVTLDGVSLKPKRKLYLALNKPRGYICSRSDPQHRPTIFGLLPNEWKNLYSVGRLDYTSEGLLFLTNDGQFCLALTHPRYGIRKKYLATVKGQVDPPMLDRLVRGVWHQGERLKAEKARLLAAYPSESLVELILAEGKNREVRRLFETWGLVVTRLKRTQIGLIKLGELPTGKWRTLTESEIKSLLQKI